MIDLPIVIGMIATVSGIVLAWFGYARSKKVDKTTEQSQLVTAQSGVVGQIISGLNLLNENLQDDNKEIRVELKALAIKFSECVAERDSLRKELNQLNGKYLK